MQFVMEDDLNKSTVSSVTSDALADDLPALTVMTVYMVLLAFMGLIGNILIVVSVAISPRLRTTSYAFIVNLSVANLAMNVLVIPLMAVAFFNYGWPYDAFWCRSVCYIFYVALGSSLLTPTMIAANRCSLVTCTRKSYIRYCGWKGTTLSLIFNWFTAIALVLFQDLAGVTTIHYNPHLRFCFPDSSEPNTYWYITGVLIRDLVLCLGIIPMLYCKTFHTLYTSKRRAGNGATRALSKPTRKCKASRQQRHGGLHPMEIKLTKMMTLIFATMMICWIPLWIVHFLMISVTIPLWVHRVGLMLILTNSAINPYLYAWLNKNFYQAYKKILRCRRNNSIRNLNVVI